MMGCSLKEARVLGLDRIGQNRQVTAIHTPQGRPASFIVATNNNHPRTDRRRATASAFRQDTWLKLKTICLSMRPRYYIRSHRLYTIKSITVPLFSIGRWPSGISVPTPPVSEDRHSTTTNTFPVLFRHTQRRCWGPTKIAWMTVGIGLRDMACNTVLCNTSCSLARPQIEYSNTHWQNRIYNYP